MSHEYEHRHTVSNDRLAQIVDGELPAFDYEVPIIAAELLARRAAAKQREARMAASPLREAD